MRRNSGYNQRNKGRKNKVRKPDNGQCWYCKKKIRGRFKYWGNHKVHESPCYGHCCANLQTSKRTIEKFLRSQPPPQKKGFFARLFGG